jgi:hypothetical protein
VVAARSWAPWRQRPVFNAAPPGIPPPVETTPQGVIRVARSAKPGRRGAAGRRGREDDEKGHPRRGALAICVDACAQPGGPDLQVRTTGAHRLPARPSRPGRTGHEVRRGRVPEDVRSRACSLVPPSQPRIDRGPALGIAGPFVGGSEQPFRSGTARSVAGRWGTRTGVAAFASGAATGPIAVDRTRVSRTADRLRARGRARAGDRGRRRGARDATRTRGRSGALHLARRARAGDRLLARTGGNAVNRAAISGRARDLAGACRRFGALH